MHLYEGSNTSQPLSNYERTTQLDGSTVSKKMWWRAKNITHFLFNHFLCLITYKKVPFEKHENRILPCFSLHKFYLFLTQIRICGHLQTHTKNFLSKHLKYWTNSVLPFKTEITLKYSICTSKWENMSIPSWHWSTFAPSACYISGFACSYNYHGKFSLLFLTDAFKGILHGKPSQFNKLSPSMPSYQKMFNCSKSLKLLKVKSSAHQWAPQVSL